ncbi:hypothetical protein [Bradyrhizobium sp. 15]|uniref:hypothetical protein n=1 Tax=Bradyrhizobium sp. 15 TaxID=2782633 RepID=UPI001FF94014|nr:hypothetical protein [Bradyrhizobium sp. 15]MCK1437384.1 hypothetical protein [Bradyrhizobium sp. 15]
MKNPISIKADVLGLIASEQADHLASYLSRGRKHQSLTGPELLEAWKAAFKHMADDVRDYARREIEEDLKQEFLARGQEPPYDLIHDDLERFVAQVDAAMKYQEATDPDGFAKTAKAVEADLNDYRGRKQN